MSLKFYFPEQLGHLKNFMVSAYHAVRCVRIDPEMTPILTRMLARLDEDPECPHLFLAHTAPFKDPIAYFDGLLALVVSEYEKTADSLRASGLAVRPPPAPDAGQKSPARFLKYAAALAQGLPDHVGSLVILIDPDAVDEVETYRRAILFLAANNPSPWLKFLVLDSRTAPRLAGLEEDSERIGIQTFYLGPEEIEARAAEDLKAPGALSPAERRQYIGLLGGLAFARKDHERAEHLQRRWLAEAENSGNPEEAATAAYNLANTLAARGAHDEATAHYCRACDVAVDSQQHALAALAYTNLGLCLHRQGAVEPAVASLRVARDTFRALNHRPGEAYVVDCLAQLYAGEGEGEKAAQAERYALSLYDGITSSSFKDLHEGGRADALAKLARVRGATGHSREGGTDGPSAPPS
jgi:tetratricopeptide (TPR) repeat protein